MYIYEAEKRDGLTDILYNKAGLCLSKIVSKAQLSTLDIVKAQELKSVEELIGDDQPDLALVVSILASVGWNLNDDIFTPEELWKSRESAIHKPMNYMHDSNIILGHIVRSCAVNKSGDEIILGEKDSIPEEFDVQVAGVLYKYLSERSDLVQEILTKAKNDEMFVSMECWFPDFAYGFLDSKTQQTKVVERNESTAFLTKHLRVFGGTGEFEGRKIGRVMKDFVFGGQGFVDEPANPESVIKVAAKRFESAGLNDILKGGVVRMENTEKMQEELTNTKSELEKVKSEKESLAKEIEDLKAEDFETKIGALNAKIEELTATVDETKKELEATKGEKVELQKKLDEAVSEAEKAQSELDKMNKSIKANERLNKLAEIKEVEDREATLAELAEMTDETFEVVLKYAGQAEEKEEKSDDENKDEAQAALNDVEVKPDGDDGQPGSEEASNDDDVALALAHVLTGTEEGGE